MMEKMQKNDALEIFSRQLNEIIMLTKIFQSIPKSIKNLTADEIANLPNDFLKSNKLSPQIKRIFIGLKVTLASNMLTFLLGRPPTIPELAVVTGESYFKIYRFIKETDVYLPYVILSKKSSGIRELQKVAFKSSPAHRAGFKTFVWKGPGKRNKVMSSLERMDSGPPNIFPVFISSPLIDTLQLTRDEKDKILTYLTSPSYVDAVKRLTVEQLKFFLKVLDTDFMRACEKILHYSLSVMWERAANLAEEKKLVQKEEFEKLPLSELVSSLHMEEFKHGLHDRIREIEEMPNETFVANCIIPGFAKGLARALGFEGLVSKPFEKDKAELRCTRCLCVSPINASSEIVTCAFCETKYKK
jgi:hypothetical protein